MQLKNMRKRLVVISLAIVSGLGGIFYYYFYPRIPLKEAEVNISQITGSGAVRLALSPSMASIPANTTTALNINIDTNGISLHDAEIKMAYSSGCSTIVISNGNFFPTASLGGANQPVISNNQISFHLGAGENGSSQGQGVLATITTGPTTGPCLISFIEGTKVMNGWSQENLIGSASDAVITVLNPETAPASISISPTSTILYNNEIFAPLNVFLSTAVPLKSFQVNFSSSGGCGFMELNPTGSIWPGYGQTGPNGGQWLVQGSRPDSNPVRGSGRLFEITTRPSSSCRISLLGGRMIAEDGTNIAVFPGEATINVEGSAPLPSATPLPDNLNPSDLNVDGRVDIYDYAILVMAFGTVYDMDDYNLLLANFGQ